MHESRTVLFVATSPNHKAMHRRFEKASAHVDGLKVTSVDLSETIQQTLTDRMRLPAGFESSAVNRVIRYAMNRLRPYGALLWLGKLHSAIESQVLAERPACVVISDNYITLIHALVFRICKENGLRLLCVPYVAQDLSDIIRSRRDNKKVARFSSGALAWALAYTKPRWVSYSGRRRVLWGHPAEIVAIERVLGPVSEPVAGMASYVDAVLVSGDAVSRRFAEYGATGNNIKVIGDICFDLIGKKSSKQKPVVLFSICPKLNRPCKYGSYFDYLVYYVGWLSRLQERGWIVVVNPHPSVTSDAIQFLERHGLSVDSRDVSELIAHADLYLSSYSSTIMLASHLGTRVIDDDIYGLGYVGNSKLENVVSVPYDSLLEDAVTPEDVASNRCYPPLKSFGAKRPPYVDGKVFQRFVGYIGD